MKSLGLRQMRHKDFDVVNNVFDVVVYIHDIVEYIYDNAENRLDLHEIKKYILHLRVSVRPHQISKSCVHQLRRAFFLVFYER